MKQCGGKDGFPISRTYRLRNSGLPSTTSFPQIRECHVHFHVSLPYPVNVATDCGPREPSLALPWLRTDDMRSSYDSFVAPVRPNPMPLQIPTHIKHHHHPITHRIILSSQFPIHSHKSTGESESELRDGFGSHLVISIPQQASWKVWEPSCNPRIKNFDRLIRIFLPLIPHCGFGKHRAYGDYSRLNFRVRWRRGEGDFRLRSCCLRGRGKFLLKIARGINIFRSSVQRAWGDLDEGGFWICRRTLHCG